MKRLQSISVIAAAFLVITALSATSTKAAVIYDWQGSCLGGCMGTATGVLTLASGYVPGTLAVTSDFISFSYSSSSGSGLLDNAAAFFAVLPTLSGAAPSLIIDTPIFNLFLSGPGGGWAMLCIGGCGPDVFLDYGHPHTFTRRLPEPGTLALIGFSLLGLGFARRRRQTA